MLLYQDVRISSLAAFKKLQRTLSTRHHLRDFILSLYLPTLHYQKRQANCIVDQYTSIAKSCPKLTGLGVVVCEHDQWTALAKVLPSVRHLHLTKCTRHPLPLPFLNLLANVEDLALTYYTPFRLCWLSGQVEASIFPKVTRLQLFPSDFVHLDDIILAMPNLMDLEISARSRSIIVLPISEFPQLRTVALYGHVDVFREESISMLSGLRSLTLGCAAQCCYHDFLPPSLQELILAANVDSFAEVQIQELLNNLPQLPNLRSISIKILRGSQHPPWLSETTLAASFAAHGIEWKLDFVEDFAVVPNKDTMLQETLNKIRGWLGLPSLPRSGYRQG